jgi:hypothetical protein
MEDKQKKYLDKVIELLVKNTKIDYEKDEIKYPFQIRTVSLSNLQFFNRGYLPISDDGATFVYSHSFSQYTKNMYGLSDQEIEYVWEEYKEIILDKISYGR